MEPAARFCKRVIFMTGSENIKSPAAEIMKAWHHKRLQQVAEGECPRLAQHH